MIGAVLQQARCDGLRCTQCMTNTLAQPADWRMDVPGSVASACRLLLMQCVQHSECMPAPAIVHTLPWCHPCNAPTVEPLPLHAWVHAYANLHACAEEDKRPERRGTHNLSDFGLVSGAAVVPSGKSSVNGGTAPGLWHGTSWGGAVMVVLWTRGLQGRLWVVRRGARSCAGGSGKRGVRCSR